MMLGWHQSHTLAEGLHKLRRQGMEPDASKARRNILYYAIKIIVDLEIYEIGN